MALGGVLNIAVLIMLKFLKDNFVKISITQNGDPRENGASLHKERFKNNSK